MKAGILEDVKRLRFSTAADPVPKRGDMLLKIEAATVCRTGIRILRGKKTAGIDWEPAGCPGAT